MSTDTTPDAGMTPGRAAYESLRQSQAARFGGMAPRPWERLDDEAREDWEAAARKAIHQRYRDFLDGVPQRVAELTAERDAARAQRDSLSIMLLSLVDRCEGSKVITQDEADEYRKLAGTGEGTDG